MNFSQLFAQSNLLLAIADDEKIGLVELFWMCLPFAIAIFVGIWLTRRKIKSPMQTTSATESAVVSVVKTTLNPVDRTSKMQVQDGASANVVSKGKSKKKPKETSLNGDGSKADTKLTRTKDKLSPSQRSIPKSTTTEVSLQPESPKALTPPPIFEPMREVGALRRTSPESGNQELAKANNDTKKSIAAKANAEQAKLERINASARASESISNRWPKEVSQPVSQRSTVPVSSGNAAPVNEAPKANSETIQSQPTVANGLKDFMARSKK